MPIAWNPATGRLEDENGNPVAGAALDQMQPAAPAPLINRAPDQALPPAIGSPSFPDFGAPAASPVASPALPAALPTPAAALPTTKSLSQTTTTRERPGPGEAAAMQKVAGGFQRQGELGAEEAGVLGRQAGAEATGAAAQADEAQGRSNELATEAKRRDEAVAAAQARVEADRQKYQQEAQRLSSMRIEDMYQGSPGALIAKALAVGLGAFGAALARTGQNTALEVVTEQERQYYEREKQKILQQKETVANAREGVSLSQQGVQEARQAKSDALADLNLRSAARMEALKLQTEAKVKEAGTEHAAILGQKVIAAAEQQKNVYLEDYARGFRTKVSTETQQTVGGGKAGSESDKLVIRDTSGNPIPVQGKGVLATARDAKAADEIDTMRAGTMDLVQNVQQLKRLANSGFTGRTSANVSGDAEGIRKDTTMHYLRATVGRINEQELKNSDQVVPSIGYVNVVRDPARVYDGFLQRSFDRTVSELSSKTNLPHEQAKTVAANWYAAAGYKPQGVPEPGRVPPAAAVQAARRRLDDPNETPERKRAAQVFLQQNGL